MSNLLTADILKVLTFSKGTNLIITVGNSFRSDDGVGSYIFSCLCRGRSPNSDNKEDELGLRPLFFLDAGYTPENIVDEAISLNPDTVVILDAADFGGEPGEVRLIPEEAIPETTLSTHMVPMSVVTCLIADATGAAIHFIGIQPKNVAMGEGLCEEVRAAADAIVEKIKVCAKPH
ncbi:MAG: hydrogenase 3 maturation endopeptidase HyCI [Candidatus Omnitrophica bacterium]|nr:hydrogenase 3 maturation endopeptidase HyCI [Candidatus Omnitrophota bacterium]